MQLTKFSDYALRVLIYLARCDGDQVTISEIARAHAVSESHLTKVVNRLGRAGYLLTARGKGGGIRLARSPQEITVGAVIRDLEPLVQVECFAAGYKGGCRLFPGCSLMRVLHRAQRDYLSALDRHTLAEISVPRRAQAI